MSAETLIEFLLARFDEDEATARAADSARWTTSPSKYVAGRYVHHDEPNGASVRHATGTTTESATHIARWDPERVLAECEAKRVIVRIGEVVHHADFCPVGWGDDPEYPDDKPECDCGAEEHVPMILRAIALPYRTHLDYRAEWAL